MADIESPFYTLRAAARRFRVSPSRLRAAIAAGELPAFQLGNRRIQIAEADLIAWVRSRPIEPVTVNQAEADRRWLAGVMAGPK